MKALYLIIFAVVVSGCATHPPDNPQNLCKVFQERDEWEYYAQKSSKKWKIPAHTLMAIIYMESGYNSHARPPRTNDISGIFGRRVSSAFGYSQALEGTWDMYRFSIGHYYADRTSLKDSLDFVGWYLNKLAKENRIPRNDSYLLYLAYHEGGRGYKKKTHLRKPGILNYARRVQKQAVKYKHQLRGCS